MKKISLLLILISFLCIHSQSQPIESNTISSQFLIEKNIQNIEEALLKKDTLSLKLLLHPNLTMGHSNGWIETKTDIPKTLIEEGVIYSSIELIGTPEIHYHSENLITSRRNINVNGIVNNVPFDVKLNVLEIWICEDGSWQLLARQSVNRKG